MVNAPTIESATATVKRPAEAPVAALSLLSGFDLRLGNEPVQVPLSAQRVVAFLGLNAGRRSRVFVAGQLWIEASEERAAAALRTALWRLGSAGTWLLACEGQSLRLAPSVVVDVGAATRIARRLVDDPVAAVPRDACSDLRDAGELLPDWYDDWVLIERERFRQIRLHALEQLCVRLSAEGRHAAAADAGLAAVAADPLRESAHRVLVAAHLAEGNPGEAMRQYGVCRRLLERDLQIAPSPALEALVAHLRHP
jgi:DNA-binding SARP family transcriptional activator